MTDLRRYFLAPPIALLTLAFRNLTTSLAAGLGWPNSTPGRVCAACGEVVRDQDPFLRYRGEHYHAGPCLEHHLAGLR